MLWRISIMSSILGIDPDVEKNGIAFAQGDKFSLHNLSFFDTLEMIDIDYLDLVIIEGGWLNKGNWHRVKNGSSNINAKIGSYVGANHAVGKLLVEYCVRNKINHEVIRPVKHKLKHNEFNLFVECNRSNQEIRDAAMLIVRNRLYNMKYKKGYKVN